MAAPKITLHARKVKAQDNYWQRTWWKCKYCDYQALVNYEDFANLRRHLRRMHPVQYMGDFIIHEESDELWALAK